MNSVKIIDLCPSLPPPLQRRSSLRTLLFSTGKSAYFSSSEPKRQIFVPYLSTSQPSYHRSYLGACYASQIPHTPVTYHGLSSPRNYSTTDLSYVPSQVRQFHSNILTIWDRRPAHQRADFTEFHTWELSFPRMSETQRVRLQALPLHSVHQTISSRNTNVSCMVFSTICVSHHGSNGNSVYRSHHLLCPSHASQCVIRIGHQTPHRIHG